MEYNEYTLWEERRAMKITGKVYKLRLLVLLSAIPISTVLATSAVGQVFDGRTTFKEINKVTFID